MSRQPADATAATALDLRFGQVGLLQARLRSLDPGAVIDELSGRIASAPQFFRSTAVCLDLASLPQLPAVAETRPVIDAVRRAGMIVVGVADGVPGVEELAKSLGLPVLAGFRAAQQSVAQVRAAAAATAAASAAAEAATRAPEPPAPPPAQSGLVHPQPVRSGQRVYARDRDLVVLGTVGAGAEVMADGCVHVYGTLRLGRNHRRHLGQGWRRQDHHQRQHRRLRLARRGKKVAVIDFDVGLRNLDLIMGCERRVVYDFVNVIHGEATLKQALIKDKRFDNLHVLAASQTRDKDALTKEGVEKVLERAGRRRLRHHRLRLAGRHREGRLPGDVLRRPGGGGGQPRSVLGARLRPHPRPAGQQDQARRARRAGAEHLLLTRYNPKRVERPAR
jgi:septum site-determining protein MinC